MEHQNSWDEYRRQVMMGMEKTDERLGAIEKAVSDFRLLLEQRAPLAEMHRQAARITVLEEQIKNLQLTRGMTDRQNVTWQWLIEKLTTPIATAIIIYILLNVI